MINFTSNENSKSGYIAIIGRPNAGKSALSNYLLEEKISMVSHKQNATRKRSLCIISQDNCQMIFVDTPGLHEREKLINQFMLSEAIKALSDCDIALFLSPLSDSIEHYESFLEKIYGKPHIVLLTKKDLHTRDEVLAKMAEFSPYQDRFLGIIPTSTKEPKDREAIFKLIKTHLPKAPFYFEDDILTTTSVREICAGFILEAIFEKVSDEIPYESDVQIESFKEKTGKDKKPITHIHATIIVEKQSQKMVFVGKDGATIKRIGIYSRKMIEEFLQMKIFLGLIVVVKKGWSKDKKSLKKQGYALD